MEWKTEPVSMTSKQVKNQSEINQVHGEITLGESLIDLLFSHSTWGWALSKGNKAEA